MFYVTLPQYSYYTNFTQATGLGACDIKPFNYIKWTFSDHKPLKNFFEGGMNTAKLDRCSLGLQEFNISLEFIQRKLNKMSDVILRLKK